MIFTAYLSRFRGFVICGKEKGSLDLAGLGSAVDSGTTWAGEFSGVDTL